MRPILEIGSGRFSDDWPADSAATGCENPIRRRRVFERFRGEVAHLACQRDSPIRVGEQRSIRTPNVKGYPYFVLKRSEVTKNTNIRTGAPGEILQPLEVGVRRIQP